MLYNFDWQKPGVIFPPPPEVERLAKYRDSRLLFEGNTEMVLAGYQQRINEIMQKLDIYTSFKSDINYHRLLTVKTADLVCGEAPNIKANSDNDEIASLIKGSALNKKLYESVIDVSRLGDSIARIMFDEKKKRNKFVIMSPDKWFPVVNIEDISDVVAHCLAWVVTELAQDKYSQPKYYLRIQEHYIGYYINKTFELKKGASPAPFVIQNGTNPIHAREINIPCYTIVRELEEKRESIKTGLNDFAIIPFQNLTVADSVYAYNDYEPITSLVAELEVRVMLENAVLDKHTAPTIYADDKNFIANRSGQMEFSTGKGVIVEKDGTVPGYMVWDASLQANHEMITILKDLLYSITEMGAVINDEAFGASQGYEALMTRLTSARMKARRISNNLTESLAKLIDLVSQRGYKHINSEDISITWNDGIPDTEMQNIDIATKKMQLFPIKNILIEHFALTDAAAQEIVDELESAKLGAMLGGFGGGVGGNG